MISKLLLSNKKISTKKQKHIPKIEVLGEINNIESEFEQKLSFVDNTFSYGFNGQYSDFF